MTINLLQIIDYAGVSVFAVSGVLAAGRKHLDLIGVLVIATVTAIGGGTLRDLLIGRHPVFWIADTGYLWVILATIVLTLILLRFSDLQARSLLVADALGLALFAISGAHIAELAGHGGIIAVILGTMSGVAGGVMRDMLIAEIPLLLRGGEIYATAAIVGIVLYLALQAAGIDRAIASYLGMATIAALRLAAIFFGLRMPSLKLEHNPRRKQ